MTPIRHPTRHPATATAATAGPADWPAIAAAQARDDRARLPFFIDDEGDACLVGSVAQAHLPALARWPQALQASDGALTLTLPAAERSRTEVMRNHVPVVNET